MEMTQTIAAENARVVQNQDGYQKHCDGMGKRYDEAKVRQGSAERTAGGLNQGTESSGRNHQRL